MDEAAAMANAAMAKLPTTAIVATIDTMIFQVTVAHLLHAAPCVASDFCRYLIPRKAIDKAIGENLPHKAVADFADVPFQADSLEDAPLSLFRYDVLEILG